MGAHEDMKFLFLEALTEDKYKEFLSLYRRYKETGEAKGLEEVSREVLSELMEGYENYLFATVLPRLGLLAAKYSLDGNERFIKAYDVDYSSGEFDTDVLQYHDPFSGIVFDITSMVKESLRRAKDKFGSSLDASPGTFMKLLLGKSKDIQENVRKYVVYFVMENFYRIHSEKMSGMNLQDEVAKWVSDKVSEKDISVPHDVLEIYGDMNDRTKQQYRMEHILTAMELIDKYYDRMGEFFSYVHRTEIM